MRIALLEPYYTGSHRRWADELVRHSTHEIRLFTLAGAHWKWRMHGSAISLFQEIRPILRELDAILVTDMIDLSTLRGLLNQAGVFIPCAIYFHENQLTYPWSPEDPDPSLQRNLHYSFINYTSALVADKVIFNSDYHRTSFIGHLPDFLRQFPDYTLKGTIEGIRSKSEVLYPGIDFSVADSVRSNKDPGSPIIVWNHRWEFDKKPDLFFHTLIQLADEGIDFRLVVLGESFSKSPDVFLEAKSRLSDRIVHWGYCTEPADYWKWLWRGHILPVTAIQDFFGYSVAEGIYCGLQPILPRRLAYPEHSTDASHFYSDEKELETMLRNHLLRPVLNATPPKVDRYGWQQLIPQYDKTLQNLADNQTLQG